MLKGLICAVVLAAATASAQEWDVGIVGGYGIGRDLTVTNPFATASTGFKNGGVFGVYGGQDMYRYWSGEANYLYRNSHLKLDSNGTAEDFAAHMHLITGDMLAHFAPKGSRFRPFVSFGGGIKLMVGTGDESRPQPLGACGTTNNPKCFAALTATNEVLPVGEVGAGVKFQVSKMFRVRLQVRDFISPKPKDVISTGPGATLSGISNDIIATVGLGLTW